MPLAPRVAAGARLQAHYIINNDTYKTVGDRAFVADRDMTPNIKKGDEYAKIFSTKANATLDVELGCVPGTAPKSGKAPSGVRYLQSVLATKAQGAQVRIPAKSRNRNIVAHG